MDGIKHEPARPCGLGSTQLTPARCPADAASVQAQVRQVQGFATAPIVRCQAWFTILGVFNTELPMNRPTPACLRPPMSHCHAVACRYRRLGASPSQAAANPCSRTDSAISGMVHVLKSTLHGLAHEPARPGVLGSTHVTLPLLCPAAAAARVQAQVRRVQGFAAAPIVCCQAWFTCFRVYWMV